MTYTDPKNGVSFSLPDRLKTILVCILLGFTTLFTITSTTGPIGWTSDEVYYFLSSELIIEWFAALSSAVFSGGVDHVLSQGVIDAYWLWDMQHNPHPPFYKILTALTLALFKNHLGEFAAYRLASALLCSVLTVFLFITLQKKYGVLAGCYASLAFFLMPRVFGHAHFGATEMPLMTFWFLSYWAFWRGLKLVSGSILLSVFVGWALATKFTGILVPGAFILWTLLYREKKALRNIVCVFTLAPLVALLVNPGWWYDPVDKILNFIAISTSREETIPIGTYFLGKTYAFSPPWMYAPVISALTVPAVTLFSFFAGLLAISLRKQHRKYIILFALNIAVMLGVAMLPNAPIHDGVRQFIYLFPFVALLAGIGFHAITNIIISRITSGTAKKIITACMLCIVAGYQFFQVIKTHPYELSYYNELAGGIRGAHRLGMETTYWYEVINKQFLDTLNRDIPANASISLWPIAQHYFEFLQEKEKVRKDIRFITPDITVTATPQGTRFDFEPETPQYLLLIARQGTFNDFYWHIYLKSTPLYSVTLDSIPLLLLYRWEDIRL